MNLEAFPGALSPRTSPNELDILDQMAQSHASEDVDLFPARGDEWKFEDTKTRSYAVDLYADG